jgi:hypothetical protein
MGDDFSKRNPGRRSQTRFALGYNISPLQGFEFRLDGVSPHRFVNEEGGM